MTKKQKLIIILIIGAILVVILFQNSQMINFHILFWTISMSQIILILFCLLSGFGIGYLAHTLMIKRQQRKNSKK